MFAIRPRYVVALLFGSLLAAPPAATAHGSEFSVTPDRAGAGSELYVATTDQSFASGGRVPDAYIFFAQRGFVLDPDAVVALCSERQAKDLACPEASRIGTGLASFTVDVLGLGGLDVAGLPDLRASIDLYLGEPAEPTDVASIYVVVTDAQFGRRAGFRGRVLPVNDGPFGLEVRLTGLARVARELFPSGSIWVKRLEFQVGAHRTEQQGVTHLITNPPACDGGFAFEIQLWFGDRVVRRTGRVACSDPA